MKPEVVEQVTRSTPAVGGAAIATLTLNEWVALATGAYVVLQIAYLVRKWWCEEGERRGKKSRRSKEQT